MNTLGKRHLTEDQFLMAVVDQDLLPATVSAHLSGCRHCLSRKEDAEEQLHQLGQRARELAPAPRKRPHLPVVTVKKPLWRFLPASAFSILLLSAIAWWGISSPPPVKETLSPAPSMAEAWEDEAIMTEISMLSENALPDEYIGLITTADWPDMDEDFFDYVVPSTDTPPLSEGWEIEGGRLC